MTHAELIAALEAATEPSRELDGKIAMLGYAPFVVHRMREDIISNAPRYTSSIDAALTLLNKVGILLSLSDIGADGLPLAIVADPTREGESTFEGIGCNLAISLCIAALKARETAP